VEELRGQLLAELGPRSAIERFLIDEIARHAAMLEMGERAEAAVLRRGAIELAAVRGDEIVDQEDDARESFLAAAVASDAIDKFSRYRRGHEKAVFSAIKTLREIGLLGPSASNPGAEASCPVPLRAWTENECEDWLRRRAAQGTLRCPGCRDSWAHWIESRRVLQCKQCRRQYGLRSGTVMARSPLPLAAWFAAVTQLLVQPDITAAELGRRAGMRRSATAQRVHAKIRAAMCSVDADQQLAGLVQRANAV
jgi:hypothetical protein